MSQRIVPFIGYEDAVAAIAWLERAFGFEENRARAEGATILRDLEEPGIGFRLHTAEDHEGHRWMFGQRL